MLRSLLYSSYFLLLGGAVIVYIFKYITSFGVCKHFFIKIFAQKTRLLNGALKRVNNFLLKAVFQFHPYFTVSCIPQKHPVPGMEIVVAQDGVDLVRDAPVGAQGGMHAYA